MQHVLYKRLISITPSYTQCKGDLEYRILVIQSLQKTLFFMFFFCIMENLTCQTLSNNFQTESFNFIFKKKKTQKTQHANQNKILLKPLLQLEITMNHPT